MHLMGMTIENYRTFRNVEFTFDKTANYVVGDNNIGKSNLLELLETIYNGYGFREGDFNDAGKPIRISLSLCDAPGNSGRPVHIEMKQKVTEVAPVMRNADTGEVIPPEIMRHVHYVSYSFFEDMQDAIDSGTLKKLIQLFSSYFSSNEDTSGVAEKLLKEFNIEADLSGNPESAALRLFYVIYGIKQNERGARGGFRIILSAGIRLMVELLRRKESRAVNFEDTVVTDRKGKRYIPLLISIDEPEVHLNPYLQRAALSYYRRILQNQDPFFLHVIQKMLGVDGLEGQLFVVTHSTDALVNDYRQIIRLYRDEGEEVRTACGSSFRFDSELEKHLIMHFPEVKEALYSRCAILVEGETEYGAFSWFALSMGVNPDYYGICLINARGESSISRISQLLKRFHIPSVCLYDRDVISHHQPSDYIFYTDGICFEMDVVNSCIDRGKRAILDAVIQDTFEGNVLVSSSMAKKACQKLGLPKQHPSRKLTHISGRDTKALKFYYFAWLFNNKGVIIGRSLGIHMGPDDIPPAFRNVILAAVKHAE